MTSDEEIMAAMLARATNPASVAMDELSVEMFCMLVRSNASLIHKSQEMLISKIRSTNVTEACNAIKLLKECMSRCGGDFQNEVAKFRFLNDLTRLVSCKYDGACTPLLVRQQIMDCLLLWTTEFPAKTKIADVYKMLQCEMPVEQKTCAKLAANNNVMVQNNSTLGIDGQELQRLIKSGDPENFKRANLLIQHRVSQASRLAEVNAQHKLMLQEVGNTVIVLSQMLDAYEVDVVKAEDGSEEMNLMRELFMACKKHKTVMKGLCGMQDTATEDLMADTLEINDKLLTVLKRYKNIVVHHATPTADDASSSASLVCAARAADNLVEELLGDIPENMLANNVMLLQSAKAESNKQTSAYEAVDLNELNDIFSNASIGDQAKQQGLEEIAALAANHPLIPERTFVAKTEEKSLFAFDAKPRSSLASGAGKTAASGLRELKGIDALSEQLFRDLNKNKEHIVTTPEASLKVTAEQDHEMLSTLINNEQKCNETLEIENEVKTATEIENVVNTKSLRLADIEVALEDVVPTAEERLLLDDADIKITLNFTENRPSAQVSVIVISVVNKSKQSMRDFVLEASVKRPAKVRLLPPTGHELSPFRLFPPPTPINQVMLLLNPTENAVDITCIVGYKLGDDPDPIKESLLAKNIPYVI